MLLEKQSLQGQRLMPPLLIKGPLCLICAFKREANKHSSPFPSRFFSLRIQPAPVSAIQKRTFCLVLGLEKKKA